MNHSKTILNQLNKELIDVTNKLEKILASENTDTQLSTVIDYLNDTIRKLDHSVEKLIDIKK